MFVAPEDSRSTNPFQESFEWKQPEARYWAGGEITIDARPAAGATIRARVPLHFKGTLA